VTLHLADVSEHQGAIDWSVYARSGRRAAIGRAHNGYRADRLFPANQRAMRELLTVRGFYGYVIAGRDPVVQAREFAAAVGRLKPGEFAACDLEEGDGDQSGRAEAWCRIVDQLCGGRTWVYSGEAFWRDHLTTVDLRRPRWVAKYSANAPRLAHVLWQHADNELHPGIGPCDCSIFTGTIDQLHQLVANIPPATTTTWSLTVDVNEAKLREIIRDETAAVVDARVRLILHGDQPPAGQVDNHPNNLDSIGDVARRILKAVSPAGP
jgi:GH25 family lysozyme M1 (1,4-beta-N-acetylmuramidase)